MKNKITEEVFGMSENTNTTQEIAKKNRASLAILEYVETFVFAIVIVVLLFSFLFRVCAVSGDSMYGTLHNKERLLISNVFYEPKQGDIVVFHQTGEFYNEPIVKRVIAVGGETINIDFATWKVTVTDKNGVSRVIDEPYIHLDEYYYVHSDQQYPLYVPEGYLFVMGDNRNRSADSRLSSIGLVDERRVLGKVIVRILPIDRFGTVE